MMRRFWMYCRQTLPWDYFTFARHLLAIGGKSVEFPAARLGRHF